MISHAQKNSAATITLVVSICVLGLSGCKQNKPKQDTTSGVLGVPTKSAETEAAYPLYNEQPKPEALAQFIRTCRYPADDAERLALAAKVIAVAHCFKIDANALGGLIRQESEFNRCAVSPSKATGLTQLTGPGIKEAFHKFGLFGSDQYADKAGRAYFMEKIKECGANGIADPKERARWGEAFERNITDLANSEDVGISRAEIYGIIKKQIVEDENVAINLGAVILKTYLAAAASGRYRCPMGENNQNIRNEILAQQMNLPRHADLYREALRCYNNAYANGTDEPEHYWRKIIGEDGQSGFAGQIHHTAMTYGHWDNVVFFGSSSEVDAKVDQHTANIEQKAKQEKEPAKKSEGQTEDSGSEIVRKYITAGSETYNLRALKIGATWAQLPSDGKAKLLNQLTVVCRKTKPGEVYRGYSDQDMSLAWYPILSSDLDGLESGPAECSAAAYLFLYYKGIEKFEDPQAESAGNER